LNFARTDIEGFPFSFYCPEPPGAVLQMRVDLCEFYAAMLSRHGMSAPIDA